jgi:hypothetical protein
VVALPSPTKSEGTSLWDYGFVDLLQPSSHTGYWNILGEGNHQKRPLEDRTSIFEQKPHSSSAANKTAEIPNPATPQEAGQSRDNGRVRGIYLIIRAQMFTPSADSVQSNHHLKMNRDLEGKADNFSQL